MSYTIHLDNVYDENLGLENLTEEVLLEDLRDNPDKYIKEYNEKDLEKIEWIISEETKIIYNYLHVLRTSQIYNETILKLAEKTRAVVIVYIQYLDTYFIALTACGMDLTKQIRLAYNLIDGESPV